MLVDVVLDDGVMMPEYAHEGDAGLDLCTQKNVIIPPHKTVMVGSGVRMAIPKTYAGFVMARSGISTKRGICLANGVGLIDSKYRGEIGLPLHNLTDTAVEVLKGERVAQLVIVPVMFAELRQVAELDETERGEGGFGSTGTK